MHRRAICLVQLALDAEKVVFRRIQKNSRARAIGGQRLYQCRANGSAGTSNQHSLVSMEVRNALHWIVQAAAQKIFPGKKAGIEGHDKYWL